MIAPSQIDLSATNLRLINKTAPERIAWALSTLNEHIILSSSFGVQAAVCLHLATQAWPGIPVIFVDTGYHFPETYRFVDELTERLKLNLKVARPFLSPAWFEAKYGKLWEQGVTGLTRYNEIMKVEPMRRMLDALGAQGWITGLRREQSTTRKNLDVVALQENRLKIHPLLDWTKRDVHTYLTAHQLPYHPLWEQGYVSIGDTHSTRKLGEGMTEEETRFGGVQRECGLHQTVQQAQ